MIHFTFDELKQILIECAGDDEQVDLDAATADTPFADLGYDSLAVLETAAITRSRYGVVLTDDDVQSARTPHDFIALVNGARPASVAAPGEEASR